uniref:Acb2/Tad1 hairpin domain-containing protein n=1 Tax=Candidatus Kentrum sp. LFY TaxID=2126342 RepID=A0A450WGY0_9GAMM|nr:MAG: hypothetical protein BECKLFY1418C_GA0070996_102238 [Candidatus Kentron sp. LFY]
MGIQNHHKQLSKNQIDAVAKVKGCEAALLDAVMNHDVDGADPRWTATAITDIEKGAMCAIRAVVENEVS